MSDLIQTIKPWLYWLHIHPHWAAVVTFVISFLECLAVVGLLVPGTPLMTAIGALVGADVVSYHMIFPAAIIGAMLGDTISFFIGYYYHDHLRDLWPFKKYPGLLQKGENFFYKHGGKGIFIGRFLGPIRPVLPIIAGMLNMPPWRFLLADIISAILWAPIYMLPGILLGAASVELAPGVAWHLILYVILLLFVLWCVSWVIQRFIRWLFNTLHRLLDRCWLAIKHTPLLKSLSVALQDPEHPEAHAQLTLGLYFLLFSVMFLVVAGEVLCHGVLTHWNTPLLYLLRSLRGPQLDHVMMVFTIMGEPLVMLGLFGIVFLYLLTTKAWRIVWHWLMLGMLGFGGAEVIKHIVRSVRPTGLLVTPSGYSFPSGHTTLSVLLFGFIAVLIARQLSKEHRWIPFFIASVIALLVAFSRLYLGAHWLTDIIGAILLAMSIIMFVTLSYRRHVTPKLNIKTFIAVVLSGWIVIATAYGYFHYKKDLTNYTPYVAAQTLNMQTWWQNNGLQEPLYRLDRLGKPVETFNVQWVGNLIDIEQGLLNKGWRISPNTTLGLVLDRLAKQNTSLELPLLPQLYLDQRPVLVMIKPIDSSHSILVLSLWDAKTTFADSHLPLWLGTVTYYHVWQTGLFHLHPKRQYFPTLSALQILEQDLSFNQWKLTQYTHQPVLLIKPR